jgi:hypothetical protein
VLGSRGERSGITCAASRRNAVAERCNVPIDAGRFPRLGKLAPGGCIEVRAPTTPRHSAVTIAPPVAMDSGDRVPFGRGLVARLIDRARGCSTAASPTATAAGMLHGGDEPQHAGQSSGLHSARRLHRQDVAVALHKERHRRLCISMGSHTGRDRAGRWTVVRHRGRPDAPFAVVSGGCQKVRK